MTRTVSTVADLWIKESCKAVCEFSRLIGIKALFPGWMARTALLCKKLRRATASPLPSARHYLSSQTVSRRVTS
jgi:hypothetical protein